MPKLSAALAKSVAKEEASDGLKPLPADLYDARLVKVESLEGAASKKPYWKWTFEIVDPMPGHYQKQFVNTSLQEQAKFKLAEVFAAFDVPTNTNTDELLGEMVTLVVVERIIEGGQHAGEIGNEVTRVIALKNDTGGEDD